jgi:glycosyl transferase family 4
MAADVLYVTFDGVLQPLAFSQVVRVLAGLGKRGLRYHLLSIERPADLDRPELRRAVDDLLRPANVSWTTVAAPSMGTPARAIDALVRTIVRAAGIVRREGIRLVHARGYQAALLARALKQWTGVPYLFDARGYWIEERSGPQGWFSTSSAYALGKFGEQALFRGAAAIVTLTDLQATDLGSGLFGPPPRLIEVIPTCTDYDAFYLHASRPTKPDVGGSMVPLAVQSRLAGKLVIGIVGALNASYFVKESLTLVKLATQMRPDAHLLVLSAQRREYDAAIQSVGIPSERYTLESAEHRMMPEWLQWIDWGLLLLPETAAKRASVPTKLAEFFATGVRPLFFGCNSEATRWVERAGSGHVLPSIDLDDLRAGARFIADSPTDYERLRTAREKTAPHFGLVSCLDRYVRLVGACAPLRRRARSADAPDMKTHAGSQPHSDEGVASPMNHLADQFRSPSTPSRQNDP